MKTSRLPQFGFIYFPILLLCLAIPGFGAVRNFAFHGQVTGVSDYFFFLDETIQPGTPVEGYYVFDSATADSNDDPTVGDYEHTNSQFGVVLKIGDYVFRTNPRNVDFLVETVDRETDSYLFYSYNNVCSHPLYVDYINWQLDGGPMALTNDTLPYDPPTLTNFNASPGLNVVGLGECFDIAAQIDSVEENPMVVVQQPPTTVSPAVRVQWSSQMGYFYQVQVSTNMQEWENIGEPVLGDGSEIFQFFPQNTNGQAYYRAEIKNFNGSTNLPAGTEIRNFTFQGTVDRVDDPDSFLGDSINEDETVEGFYVFDHAASDSNDDPTVGDYQHTNSLFGIVVKIGEYIFRTNPKHVDFLMEMVDGESDHQVLRSYNNVCSQPVTVEHISSQLNCDSNALTNDALPDLPLILTNLNASMDLYIYGVDDRFMVIAEITSVEQNPTVIQQLPKSIMREASVISWQSQLGCYYQLQTFEDEANWADVGEPILGDGGEISTFLPRPAVGHPSFRAIVKSFEEE